MQDSLPRTRRTDSRDAMVRLGNCNAILWRAEAKPEERFEASSNRRGCDIGASERTLADGLGRPWTQSALAYENR